MTIEEIMSSTKTTLSPTDVASVIGCSAYNITLQARKDRDEGVNSFPFPVIIVGTRTKIPRKAFLQALGELSEVE